MPVSVDQVSAAVAAFAPAPAASQVTEPVAIQAIAASANTPPLDITCNASRAPVFERIPRVISRFCVAWYAESAVVRVKKTTRRIPQLQPAVTAIVPTIAA